MGFGVNPITEPGRLGNINNPEMVDALRVFQLFNAAGVFVFPPLLFWWLMKPSPSALAANTKFNFSAAMAVVIVMVAALPFINWLAYVNELISFPEVFKHIEIWMREAEEEAKVITEALLNMDTFQRFLMNFLVIAIVPAIGEEFFFRGTLQPLIDRIFGNKHLAIWITAFLFSALHMQFLGFFPRMLLGALFGYLFVWSGNIWYPVIGHLTNNGLAVMAAYFIQQGKVNPDVEHIGKNEVTFSVGGLLLMCFMLYSFYKTIQQKKEG